MAVTIDTERLRLRPPVPDDLAAIHAIQSREDVARWLYWEPRSEADVRELLRAMSSRPPEMGVMLAVELIATGELVGHVSLAIPDVLQRQGEIGFIFHPDHQGRGYATEAGRALLALAFGDYGLHRVYGRLEPRNEASARVLEKLGMRREAHLIENEWVKGEWQSEAIYALLAREWAATVG